MHALIRASRLRGASTLGISSTGPGDAFDKRFCRNELAGLSIEHVEKPVLRRLHDDLAHPAADVQFRKHERLGGVVIPVLSGCRLKVPHQLTVACSERQYAGEVQIVAS